MSRLQAPPKNVYFPLQKFEQCSVCGKTEGLRLCSACSEEIYCSEKCQQKDWKDHKVWCGGRDLTVKLDISNFYPFLATLMEVNRAKHPSHPAFKYRIMNHYEASPPQPTPDGGSVRVILLESLPNIDAKKNQTEWWPSAPADSLRLRLQLRLSHEGYLVPNYVAAMLGVLARIYTTTAVKASSSPTGQAQKRLRIHYRSAPIADFGIAKGTIALPEGSELEYHDTATGKIIQGQNPRDHYWIYFRNVKGDECILDCGLVPFGMEFMAFNHYFASGDRGKDQAAYQFHTENCPTPCLFVGKEMKKSPIKHEAKEHFSMLHNKDLADAIRHSAGGLWPDDLAKIKKFAEQVAGRSLTTKEAELLKDCAVQDIPLFDRLLNKENWAQWPKTPRIDFHNFVQNDYPQHQIFGNGKDADDEKVKDLHAFLPKWNRRYRRGAITYDEWLAGVESWRVQTLGPEDDLEDDEDEEESGRPYPINTNPIIAWVD